MLDRFLKKPVFELQGFLQHGNIIMYTLPTHLMFYNFVSVHAIFKTIYLCISQYKCISVRTMPIIFLFSFIPFENKLKVCSLDLAIIAQTFIFIQIKVNLDHELII